MTGPDALNSTSSAYYLQLQQMIANVSGGLSGADGTTSTSTDSAPGVSTDISPAGQLFSNLQQLQAQDPTKFKEVVSQIAGELQAAAQQQGQGGASNFLTNLADKFQNVANGGDVSQLQPHHHHGHHSHSTYNSAGQGVTSTAPVTSANGPGTNLDQLFANINTEVTQALGS